MDDPAQMSWIFCVGFWLWVYGLCHRWVSGNDLRHFSFSFWVIKNDLIWQSGRILKPNSVVSTPHFLCAVLQIENLWASHYYSSWAPCCYGLPLIDWKNDMILSKLSSIWMKMLNDIACNLNWIGFNSGLVGWTLNNWIRMQFNWREMIESNWIQI
jgi:hypothetical protein